MMKLYNTEARKRISKLGTEAVSNFFEKVPKDVRSAFYERLPTRNGFRPTEPKELQRRISALVKTISDEKASDSKNHGVEWGYVQSVWRIHAKGIQGGRFSKVVEETLNLGISAKEFYTQVVEIAGADGICRRDMNDLLMFSPFPDIEEELKQAALLPTSEQLSETKRLRALPGTVDDLKASVVKIQGKLQEVAFWAESAQAANERQDKIQSLVEGLSSSTIQSRQELDRWVSTYDGVAKKVSELANHIAEIDALLVNSRTDVRTLQDEVRSLSENVAKKFSTFERTLGELSRTFTASKSLDDFIHVQTELEALGERVGLLEEGLIQVSAQPPTVVEKTVERKESSRWEALTPGVHKSAQIVKPLSTFTDVVELLEKNYKAVGVDATQAKRISSIVAVGISSGQLVQFGGSLADVLLDATCVTLGERYLNWTVPLGLCDSEQGERAINIISTDPNVGCLAIRGANRSAFEVYGDNVRRTIVDRHLLPRYHGSHTPILCSLVDGPGTIPPGTVLIQLGPTIESDHLKWMRQRAELKPGRKDFEDWPALIENTSPDFHGVLGVVSTLPIFTSALSRMVLEQALELLCGSAKLKWESAVENLLLGWVAPLLSSGALEGNALEEALRREMPEIHSLPAVEKILASFGSN